MYISIDENGDIVFKKSKTEKIDLDLFYLLLNEDAIRGLFKRHEISKIDFGQMPFKWDNIIIICGNLMFNVKNLAFCQDKNNYLHELFTSVYEITYKENLSSYKMSDNEKVLVFDKKLPYAQDSIDFIRTKNGLELYDSMKKLLMEFEFSGIILEIDDNIVRISKIIFPNGSIYFLSAILIPPHLSSIIDTLEKQVQSLI